MMRLPSQLCCNSKALSQLLSQAVFPHTGMPVWEAALGPDCMQVWRQHQGGRAMDEFLRLVANALAS
eukprot:6480861-Amphidinium_carterae.4